VSEHVPLTTSSKPLSLSKISESPATRPPRVLPLRYFPDPILTKKCEPIREVTNEIRQLAYDMLLTMMKGDGIGLAAPQVGHAIRMVVADIEWPEKKALSNSFVLINPVVKLLGDPIKSVEGCLSFPGERFDRKRANKVGVLATDLDGSPFSFEAEGVLAVVIQHENDHLNGKTVASELSWMKRDLLRKAVVKRVRRGR